MQYRIGVALVSSAVVLRMEAGCYIRKTFNLARSRLMARGHKFSDPLDQQIYDAHRHYIEVMEDIRLATISAETKEKYLRIISPQTETLAPPRKPLSEIIGEMMTEAAPFLFQTMQNR